ncbi:peptidase M3A and M3B thimet/oligopeptidase F, partial [Exiguobacterium sp. IPBC4]
MEEIEGIYSEVHDAQTQYGRLLWTQYTAGYDFGLKDQYQKITSLLKNEKSYELVREALETEQDPLNKRKLQLVDNLFKPYHLSQSLNELDEEIQGKVSDLSKLLNQFRYTFQG